MLLWSIRVHFLFDRVVYERNDLLRVGGSLPARYKPPALPEVADRVVLEPQRDYSDQGARRARFIILAAESSPTMVSAFGSQVILRPVRIAMSPK
jgi:hypothetical protein